MLLKLNANCSCLLLFFYLGIPKEEIFSIKKDFAVIVQSRANQLGLKQTDLDEEEVQFNTHLIYSHYMKIKAQICQD